MTDRAVRPGKLGAASGSGRQPVISVVMLGGDITGALAYALECALFVPTAVRVVRMRASLGAELPSPLPVLDLVGRSSGLLRQLSACSDRMVAQSPGSETDRFLVDLRQHTYSPLVEVDQNGVVLRVSDPRGWSMPAAPPVTG